MDDKAIDAAPTREEGLQPRGYLSTAVLSRVLGVDGEQSSPCIEPDALQPSAWPVLLSCSSHSPAVRSQCPFHEAGDKDVMLCRWRREGRWADQASKYDGSHTLGHADVVLTDPHSFTLTCKVCTSSCGGLALRTSPSLDDSVSRAK